MSYEIKICDILKGAAMEGQYKGAQRGAKCEEIANELTRRGVKNNKGEVITKGGVSHWLEGRREPNFDTLAELCDMFGVYALMPMRGGKWIRVHPEDRGEMELREAVAERDAIIDDLKARIAELEAALANKQVPAEAEEMGGEKVEEVAAEQAPNDEKEMGAKEWVNPNPKNTASACCVRYWLQWAANTRATTQGYSRRSLCWITTATGSQSVTARFID